MTSAEDIKATSAEDIKVISPEDIMTFITSVARPEPETLGPESEGDVLLTFDLGERIGGTRYRVYTLAVMPDGKGSSAVRLMEEPRDEIEKGLGKDTRAHVAFCLGNVVGGEIVRRTEHVGYLSLRIVTERNGDTVTGEARFPLAGKFTDKIKVGGAAVFEISPRGAAAKEPKEPEEEEYVPKKDWNGDVMFG